MEQFAWFALGAASALFIEGLIITVWVRTRGPFVVSPPEPPENTDELQ